MAGEFYEDMSAPAGGTVAFHPNDPSYGKCDAFPESKFAGEELVNMGAPHVEQYFGPWAVYQFQNLMRTVEGMDLQAHIAQARAAGGRTVKTDFEVIGDGVALIEIEGTLTKYRSSLFGTLGTIEIRRQIQNATRDPAVKAIVLRIDSPGGTVAGTQELGDVVAAAAKRKPVTAYIEDLGASAAYWVASQANQVFANRTAMVGSIGTFGVVYDYSAKAEKEGIKALVFKAGEHKGAGVPGTEVTDEQQAEYQRIVDGLNKFFLQAVSKGRKMTIDRVRGLADGRIHVAGEAAKLGLIDGVRTFDDVIRQAIRPVGANATGENSTGTEGDVMSETQVTNEPVADQVKQAMALILDDAPIAASYEEIKAECEGADSTFICGQLEAKATVEQARRAYMAELKTRTTAAEKRAEKAEDRKPDKPGVDALGTGKGGGESEIEGDAVAQWDEAINAKMTAGKSKVRAVSELAKENPDLHQAMLAEYNQAHKAKPTSKSANYGRDF